MDAPAQRVQRTYLTLMLGNTFAASLIWGINTLFLLDAGLSNLEAFAANAFFTAGMVVFEVPTGVVADTRGRRASYLLGTVTLAASTLMYCALWQAHGPFWMWAVVSVLIGLGFTFFSGAVEAWLVDALHHAGHDGPLEEVLGRGQVAAGVAMLAGSVGGGVLAQATTLGAPFLLRSLVLVAMFAVAWRLMHDEGFDPEPGERPLAAVRAILDASLEHGLRNPPVRWVMLAAPINAGVGIYAFYALQPYLLELYGDAGAYAIAGLAAAVFAGSAIAGGMLAPRIRRIFRLRTSALIVGGALGAVLLGLVGVAQSFWPAIVLLALGGLVGSATTPIRQAYVNDMIPSRQRATVLSFDSLMGSAGGVVVQPALGRTADVAGYGTSFVVGAGLQVLALPLLLLSRREHAPADRGHSLQSPDPAMQADPTISEPSGDSGH